MNIYALQDVLNDVILSYMLRTYTNPTILIFRTVSKAHLKHLIDYIHSVYEDFASNDDQSTDLNSSDRTSVVISCLPLDLVLPRFDLETRRIVCDFVEHVGLDSVKKASKFPLKRIYYVKEGLYYSTALNILIDEDIQFNDKITLIEREIYSLDHLLTNSEFKYFHMYILLKHIDDMSNCFILRLIHYIEDILMVIYGVNHMIDDVELAVKVGKRFYLEDLFFDEMNRMLFVECEYVRIRRIHRSMLICVQLNHVRFFEVTGLRAFSSNIDLQRMLDEDQNNTINTVTNTVWLKTGENYTEEVDHDAGRRYRISLNDDIKCLYKQCI